MSLFKTRYGKTDWQAVVTLVGIVILSAVILTAIGIKVAGALHTQEATIEVTKKERLQKITNGNSTFVHNVEGTTDIYTVEDSLLQWEWRSASTYADIKVGTCDVVLQGYRIGFLSMKHNILKANCNKPKETN